MSPEYPHVLTRRLLRTSVIAAHPASLEALPNGTPVSPRAARPVVGSVPGGGRGATPPKAPPAGGGPRPPQPLQRSERGLEHRRETLFGLGQGVRSGERGGEQRGRFETDGHGVRPVVVRDGKERCPRWNVGGGGEPEVADAAGGCAGERHPGLCRRPEPYRLG